ncbi:hypothetical protein [Acinetobacter sp. TR11]|uniref:hypothetical protein n=1 Tax=Acinetobacter sp. TR11 TaxID=3003393 RepID=UPI0022AC4C8E|nr:hypothetical protein [Acinetobacter sp. TR11]WAU73832.1 hypothetical protein O1450_01490 [Acinetobacter sp. TR11]
MKVLIISKHLLNLTDAQSQQTLAFIEAMQEICERIDIITATTIPAELSSLSYLTQKNTTIYTNNAEWITNGNSLFDKIKRKIHRNILAIMESKWVISSQILANNLDLEYNYSAIISIGLPIESHIVGLKLKNKSKWIAHFSDPWPESIMPKPYSDYSIPIINKLQKNVVKKVLNCAKIITFTCTQSRDLFLNHYSFDAKKSYILPHIAPNPVCSVRKSEDSFLITYAGSLSRERFFSDFFIAIANLPKSSNIVIQFIGYIHENAINLIKNLNIENRFIIRGQLNKEETLRYMQQSNALLLIEAKMEIYPFLPSKLADYSAIKNIPIYAVTGENSATSKLILKYNAGFVSTYNKDEIKNTLLTMEKIKFERNNKAESLYDFFSQHNVKYIIQYIISNIIV